MPAAACDAKRKPATCAQHAAKTTSPSSALISTVRGRVCDGYFGRVSPMQHEDMAVGGEQRELARVVLRRLAAGGLLCGLAGAAVAVGSGASGTAGRRAWLAQLGAWSDAPVGVRAQGKEGWGSQWSSEDGLRDSAPASMWRPFPVQGLNVGYSKLAPAFEAEALEAPPGSLALREQPPRPARLCSLPPRPPLAPGQLIDSGR